WGEDAAAYPTPWLRMNLARVHRLHYRARPAVTRRTDVAPPPEGARYEPRIARLAVRHARRPDARAGGPRRRQVPTRPHLLDRRARSEDRRAGRGRAIALLQRRPDRAVGRGRPGRGGHPVAGAGGLRP